MLAVPNEGRALHTVIPPDTEQARWFNQEVQPHESALRAYLQCQFPAIDADDIVQESYLRLLRVRKIGKIASVKAYLFSIARNAALGIFRQRRMRREVSVNDLEAPIILHSSSNVIESINESQELALVAEAIASLPSRCGEVVALRVLHRLSHCEIAAKLGISENTVRVQMMRGMLKCTDFLRARGITQETSR